MRKSFIVWALVATLAAGAVRADDAKSAGGLTVEYAWARASAGMVGAGAAYATIRNGGNADDRLIGVAATSVAGMAMLHTTVDEGGVMKMRHVDAIPIKAGETVTLRPGRNHVMLMGLKAPLKEGQRFPLALRFEKAGTVTVEVEVKAPGASGEHHGKHHH